MDSKSGDISGGFGWICVYRMSSLERLLELLSSFNGGWFLNLTGDLVKWTSRWFLNLSGDLVKCKKSPDGEMQVCLRTLLKYNLNISCELDVLLLENQKLFETIEMSFRAPKLEGWLMKVLCSDFHYSFLIVQSVHSWIFPLSQFRRKDHQK